MNTFKLYVTDKSKTLQTLQELGYDTESKSIYVEVRAPENEKMNIIKQLTRAKIIIFDIG